jgi:hypothetical protein
MPRTLHIVAALAGLALGALAPAAIALANPLAPGEYAEPVVGADLFAPLIAPIAPLLGKPGSTTDIAQLGVANTATSQITGDGNLSLIAQSGHNNHAYQAIEGTNSALLLLQGGHDNSVIQAAKGNDDFQLIGVSGHNNKVAYLQDGNNLNGALDVGDSTNSEVFALQTPQSGNYLMPVGLHGLKNTVVIIVPGRMYVIPRH